MGKKKPATLSARLREHAAYACDDECEGRCRECPADVMREAADKLDAIAAEVERTKP